ncbi:MAG: RNA polymerase sigma-70 factor (ECF subfamily) [Halieaceae bacterium]|jgi:RNA polymerase sigma-70 factor (ECF subfamily)
MGHKDDLKLARGLLDGDERLFDQFFREYFPRLYRFTLSRVEDQHDIAQDIVQTTLMNATGNMENYRGEAAMFSWLCQICRNEISAHYRRLSRTVPLFVGDDDALTAVLESLESSSVDDPEALAERVQLRRLIQDVLDRLPSNYGNALEWKYIDGFSVGEIAERLAITDLAAQSTLARARVAFRDAMSSLMPRTTADRL